MGYERVADGHLPHLAAGRLVDPESDFDAAEGNRIRGRGFPFCQIVDHAIVVIVDAICALVCIAVAILVDAIALVMRAPSVIYAAEFRT
jgi:hypothetical protein